MRRGQRRRDQRGAAAVEFALIVPVFLLIVFGIIEMAFLLRDEVAVTSATRVGARQATAVQTRDDAANCRGADDPDLVCAPRSVPAFVQVAATAMQENGSAMPMKDVIGIAVFDATEAGDETGPATQAACSARCVWFRWVSMATAADPNAGEFRWVQGTWDARTIDRCPTSAHQLGVKMVARHRFATGMFDQIEIDDVSVMTFEPLPLDECEPV